MQHCRITRVTPYVVGMGWRNCVFAHVETDDGIDGIGEGSMEHQPQGIAEAIARLADGHAIGRSAFDTERLVNETVRHEFARSPIVNSAIAAIEMACWDIVGKALGVPVYALLGGRVRDERIPAYALGWHRVGFSESEISEAARAAANAGYRGLKFDPFDTTARDPDRSAIERAGGRVRSAREAVGPMVDLMIDGHGRFSPASAIAIAQAMEPYGLYWFEEPSDPDSSATLAAVGRNIRTRLATGERCLSRSSIQAVLETHEVDVLQPDIVHVGGIMEAKKIAAMADALYVPVSFHNPFGPVATAAALQLDTCTTNVFSQESCCAFDVPWRFDLVENAPRPVDGHYEVTTAPGLGVGAFRPEVAAAHPFDPQAVPPLLMRR